VTRRTRRGLGLFAALALAALSARVDAKEPAHAMSVAFVGPLSGPLAASGEESWLGLALRLGIVDGAVPPALQARSLERYDDKGEPEACEKALAAALATKPTVLVCAATGRTLETIEARAKKAKVPTILVGSAGHRPNVDPAHPIVSLAPWPGDLAVEIGKALQAPCASVTPALVVEDTPRGRELEAAIRRNVSPRQTIVGTIWVAGGGVPAYADLAKAKAARCDRLVLVGEPDLVDRTIEELAALSWEVPFLATEGMASAAAKAFAGGAAKGSYVIAGATARTPDGAPRPMLDALEKQGKGDALVLPRTLIGWTAGDLLVEAWAGGARKAGALLAALRVARHGKDEEEATVLDVTGRCSLWRWRVWQTGAKGLEPVDATWIPSTDYGALFRQRSVDAYAAEAGTKVVWVTFGDKQSKAPRTIEKDMADLHLGTRGYEGDLDAAMLEELMARALGKLNRLFLRNQDGTAVPGVSWQISFTAKKPEKAKPSDYWTAVIAGDDAEAGGRAWPGEGRCEIYATFLKRTIFLKDALEPRMSQEDKTFVDGTYVKTPYRLQHLRMDQIRALVDGFAGSFALTGAHEIGHLAGLDHDTTDPRSLMNVVEGAGLRESHAFFVPAHAAILDRVLGRAPSK
jgi:ABC-type branched-subunit amino acid transport system substrate-binding protein